MLLIDELVEQLADLNFRRRPSTRVTGSHELVVHVDYIICLDQNEGDCTDALRAVVL